MGSPDEIIGVDEESEAGFYVVPNPFKEQVTPQRLWFSHDDDASAFTMYSICRFQSSPLASKTEITYRSAAFSPTSSEATTIAAKNLTTGVSEKNDAFFLKVCLGEVAMEEEQLTSPPRVQDSLLHSRTAIMEEPSEHGASCGSALSSTPRQITELFGTFQPRKKTPDMKPSLSTPREELLFRECILYKQIIQDDTNTILNLKQELEQLQNVMANKDMDLEDTAVEIRIALDRIDALKREKEMMREHEDDLNETIRILNLEIDKLSPPEDIEDELSTVDELPNQIIASDEERGSLQSVGASLDCDAPELGGQDSHSQDERRLELGVLSMKIQDIINRLILVEAKQQLADEKLPRALDSQRSERGDSREGSQPTRKSEDFLAISHDQDEVEVVLPDSAKEVHSTTDVDVDCCCMVWTMSLHGVE
jgi:hypothetical protein